MDARKKGKMNRKRSHKGPEKWKREAKNSQEEKVTMEECSSLKCFKCSCSEDKRRRYKLMNVSSLQKLEGSRKQIFTY